MPCYIYIYVYIYILAISVAILAQGEAVPGHLVQPIDALANHTYAGSDQAIQVAASLFVFCALLALLLPWDGQNNVLRTTLQRSSLNFFRRQGRADGGSKEVVVGSGAARVQAKANHEHGRREAAKERVRVQQQQRRQGDAYVAARRTTSKLNVRNARRSAGYAARSAILQPHANHRIADQRTSSRWTWKLQGLRPRSWRLRLTAGNVWTLYAVRGCIPRATSIATRARSRE